MSSANSTAPGAAENDATRNRVRLRGLAAAELTDAVEEARPTVIVLCVCVCGALTDAHVNVVCLAAGAKRVWLLLPGDLFRSFVSNVDTEG